MSQGTGCGRLSLPKHFLGGLIPVVFSMSHFGVISIGMVRVGGDMRGFPSR